MLDPVRSEPALIDKIHDQLVDAISVGRLPPGERLTQERVAKLLSVSRQPVSHALQLLKHRGLAVRSGRKGLAVAPLDAKRIWQLYQVREALDGLDPRSLGQFAVVLATICYAFASVWGRVALTGTPVEMNAAGMLLTSAAMALPIAFLTEGAPSFDLPPGVRGALAGMAILGTAAAYLLYFEILRLAGAGNTMLVTLVIPPFAIALGAVFLGERLAPSAFFGFGLIALGLAVIDGRLFRRRSG